MSRGLARASLWLACLLLPACGYSPKKPTDARPGIDANTASPDSAVTGDGLSDSSTAKDTDPIPDGHASVEAQGPVAEVNPPDAIAPDPDTSPATEPDTAVRLDARVFLDVPRAADRPQDLPPDNPPLPTDSAVAPSDTSLACGAPPEAPVHASLGFEGPNQVGSVATYACNTGYRATNDGSASVRRTCLADGTWDGQAIECAPVNCGPPPTIPNGNAPQYTTTTYKSTATYSCLENYVLSASADASCVAEGTWSPVPTCAPLGYRLTVIKNGSATDTVNGPSAGIACGPTCEATVQAGTAVSLTATAATDGIFLGWGAPCSGRESCAFTMSADTTVRANFSPPPNIIFVTSTKQSANLGGLAGADALCNQRANAVSPPLRGTYKAWLSTSTASAASRMGTASGWVRPDGLPVLNRLSDLLQGKMFYPPRLDETGADQGHITVMTASMFQGTILNTSNATTCGDFTSTANPTGTFVLGGFASASGHAFTETATLSCQDEQRIYCMGVDNAATILPPTPAQGRHAFTTKDTWIPGGGIESADALCQAEATRAALPGTYKALLASNGSSAASRFSTASGLLPWIRTDGIRLTATAAGFFTTALLDVPPNMSADGAQYIGSFTTWSGAPDMTTAGTPTTTCLNWLSGQLSDTGRAGQLSLTGTVDFFGGFENSCIGNRYLICLQE